MAVRSAPAPFLTKTFQLIDDPSTNDVVSWNVDGSTFVVWKTAEFAKDLLPKYFKHNNFSSFVRQLNTYGFRKTVPDKWEFANEHFKKGQAELLTEIRRRKAVVAAQAAGKPTGGSSPSNSGEDLGSTSTSSPGSKNQACADEIVMQFSGLSDENEKLKKDNEMLNSELARAKKQCEELVSFIARCMKVGVEEIDGIMKQQGATVSSSSDPKTIVEISDDDDEEDEEFENEEVVGEEEEDDEDKVDSLKLFGVWLKGEKETKNKRCRDEAVLSGNDKPIMDGGSSGSKKMKNVEFDAWWLKMSTVPSKM
uniref:HSF-type DNA-binding domain-containing protein n=1 Tax=Kalanchoe fedtschenkoi TaxID=63787 RepID=A0A7N0T9S5_KALFE